MQGLQPELQQSDALGSIGGFMVQISCVQHFYTRYMNEEVDKNRHILRLFNNVQKNLGAVELALRAHDETSTSDNPGIYVGVVNFTAEISALLAIHMKGKYVQIHMLIIKNKPSYLDTINDFRMIKKKSQTKPSIEFAVSLWMEDHRFGLAQLDFPTDCVE
nr:unnamed protein product [Callosobruchus analis]